MRAAVAPVLSRNKSTLARLAKDATLSAEARQAAEQACTQGQQAIQTLHEQQARATEHLQRMAAELDQSAHLAPLSDALECLP